MRNVFDQRPHTLQLLRSEDRGFDERQAAVSQLHVLVGTAKGQIEQFIVLFQSLRDNLSWLAAGHTSHAIRIETETQFFVPILLLVSEEYEGATTISTNTIEIKVMCHLHGRERLTIQICDDCGTRNSFDFGRVKPLFCNSPCLPGERLIPLSDLAMAK